MKRKFISLALAASLGLSLLPTTILADESLQDNTQEQVIVVFKNNTNDATIIRHNGKIRRKLQKIHAASLHVTRKERKLLESDPNVLAVEPDIQVKIDGQIEDWGIGKINANQARTSGYTGKGVKIAIVDTGIAAHQDLRISGGTSTVDYTSGYQDDNGHGTHVAGIVGALDNGYGSVGVAPEASLYAVKALGKNGSGYLSDIIAGIDWSIDNHMDIINLSLGTSVDSLALHQAVDKAYQNGIMVVAAAGNIGSVEGTNDTVEYPARYSSVIAVSAINQAEGHPSFSSAGSKVEVAAPGDNILSTYLGNQYARMSGTSMATPYVSGDIALWKQAYPSSSVAELRSLLQKNAKDIGPAGRDNLFGYGLIQAPVKTGAPVQTPTPSTPVEQKTKDMVTKIYTNKSAYYAGEAAHVTVQVTDKKGYALKGAAVSLSIVNPMKQTGQITGRTNAAGTVSFTVQTTSRSAKGTYEAKAAVKGIGYADSNASLSFKLADIYSLIFRNR